VAREPFRPNDPNFERNRAEHYQRELIRARAQKAAAREQAVKDAKKRNAGGGGTGGGGQYSYQYDT
jgi:hypothetical protein